MALFVPGEKKTIIWVAYVSISNTVNVRRCSEFASIDNNKQLQTTTTTNYRMTISAVTYFLVPVTVSLLPDAWSIFIL